MNVRYWANFELSTLHTRLRRTGGSIPYLIKVIRKKEEDHAIIDKMVDEIHMFGSKKVSAVSHEAPEFFGYNYNANNLYQVENMSLNETKDKME